VLIKQDVVLSQRWPRDAPYKLFHPNFVHAYRTVTILCADLILNELKLRKFCLFLQEWRFCRSSSSEVIYFGANQKCVCDFLLVHNSKLGPILHHFGDMTAFMCTRSPMLRLPSTWALSYLAIKLFLKYSNLCENHTSMSQTDRRTDRQTTYCGITALCVTPCGKN